MIMQWQQQRVDKRVREDLPLHMNPQWINEWLYGFVMVLTLLHITSHLIFLCYVGSNMHYNKIMYAHDIFINRALNEKSYKVEI